MIDLSTFYDPDDIRSQIAEPMSDARHTYATNGHILIRVARRPEIAEAEFAARCVKLLAEFAVGDQRQWFSIPELPAKINFPCGECHGTGFVEKPQSVDVGDTYFARKYLAVIAALPGSRISPNGRHAAWWKCEGCDGLLMPVRKRVP